MADDPSVDQPIQYAAKAKQEAQGWYDAGVFDAFEGVVNNGLTKAANTVAQLFFGSLDAILVLVAKAIFAVLGDLDPAFGTIASLVVGNMFDVQVDTSAFTNMYDGVSRKAVSKAVGANLLAAFKGDQAAVGAGELQPSTTAAESYLGIMANLAIEGWTFDTLGGCLPLVHLEHLGALNEQMASVLGLGRMSRAVLRPFVNTLIATPALWAVNKQYRPKMLSVSEAIAANMRGDVDEATLLEICARDGYGDDAIAALRNAARHHMSPADIDLRLRAGQLAQPDAIAALRLQGFEDGPANELLNLEELKARRAHIFRIAAAAMASYADHRSDGAALRTAIDNLGFDQTTLQWLHDEADARRTANTPHMSHAEVIAAVKAGILNVTDYATWLSARGYDSTDAVTLELVLQNELNVIADKDAARAKAAAVRASAAAARANAAQARRDAIAAQHADWTGTLAQAERLVVRSVMPTTQYHQLLVDHNLSAGDADALVTIAVQDRDARTAQQAKRAAAAAAGSTKTLSLAALERATIMGALSIAQLGAELTTRGYDQADAAVIVDLVNDGIAARAAALVRSAAAAAKLTSKGLSLAQVQKAVVDGVQTLAQYQSFLTAQKFDATSVATLVADMQVQLDNRQLANERHELAVEKLAASHLSLAEEEKAVVDGILTLTDYTGYLAAHDFDAADQAILTALLETKLPAQPLA